MPPGSSPTTQNRALVSFFLIIFNSILETSEMWAGRSFPAEVLPLCMPSGLRFATQKELGSPTFHTIANIRADGSRLHGAVLTFYEPVG